MHNCTCAYINKLKLLLISAVLGVLSKKKKQTEEKAKVVADDWETDLNAAQAN